MRLHRNRFSLGLLAAMTLPFLLQAAPTPPKQTSPTATTVPLGDPRSLELNEQGIAAIKARNLKQAEELFRKAISADAKNITAVFNLAGVLMANKKEKEAIDLLTHYLKDYPEDPGMWVRLGDAWFASKNIKEAAKAYEKAAATFPNYPGLAAKLGTIYGLQNKIDLAEKMFLQAVAEDPKNHQLLANLASIFLGNGKPDKAISTAKRALAIKATSEVYITLGTAYEIQKDYKNALIAFQRAADLGDKREELKKKIAALKESVPKE